MKLKHSYITYLLGFLIIIYNLSCSEHLPFIKSDNYKRPIMRKSDRKYYVIDYGSNLSWDIKEAFEEGKIIQGMPYYMVELLYGEPDLVIKCPYQSLLCDKIIVYQTNNDHTVGSISIKADTIVKASGQLTEKCRF